MYTPYKFHKTDTKHEHPPKDAEEVLSRIQKHGKTRRSIKKKLSKPGSVLTITSKKTGRGIEVTKKRRRFRPDKLVVSRRFSDDLYKFHKTEEKHRHLKKAVAQLVGATIVASLPLPRKRKSSLVGSLRKVR